MATVNSTTANSNSALFASINGTSGSGVKATSADEMQTRFLNLLVTQLKNQDPLNPMDNAQMTTQLSQISTVSGIEKLNATLEKLVGSYAGTQQMQAAAMIGKTVLTAGSSLPFNGTGAVAGISLAEAADRVTLTIKDAAGRVVQTENIGAQEAGTINFAWDGRSLDGTTKPAGNYTFSVAATRGDKTVEATTLQAGTVNAVTIATDGLSLQLANGKSVNYSDIKQIM